MFNLFKKNKEKILNLSLKKIYRYFFLSDFKPESYYAYIKNLVIEFITFKYPNSKKEKLEEILNSLISDQDNYKDLMSELNLFFNPTFDDDIEFHYKYYENNIFFKFILYSTNIKLINNKYSKIYEFAISEIDEPLDILEIGGGLPHGFFYNIWKKDKYFFNSFNYIDANLLHAEFVDWYCKKIDIQHNLSLFPASKKPKIENTKFNFVFAKDIFEHLDKPDLLIDDLIKNTKNKKNLLCLDLEHKGDKTVQHLNPNLPILKKKLINNKFEVIKKFEEIHIWKKIN